MKIGNVTINKIKLGIPQIVKVFRGIDLVWSRFLVIIDDFKARVLGNQGQFEGETCLNDTLEDMGIDLFEQASLVVTPNGYKENVLYSVKPTEAGTNLLLNSEAFENGYWNKTRCTISTNQEIAPNGSLTADYVVEDSTTGLRYVGVIGVPTTIGQTWTFSIFVKKKDRAQIGIQINEGNAIFPTVKFNFDSQSFTQTSTLVTSSFQSVGNGWFRLIFTRTPTTGTSTVFGIYPLNASGDFNQTGDGVSRTIIWGAQLELGSTVGNYIPTTYRQVINETICDFNVVRATIATRINSDGLIEPVPYNLFSYSEEFNNTYWNKTNQTITSNQAIAPDGNMNADLYVPNTVFAEHQFVPVITTSNSGVFLNTSNTYNWSIYAKPAGNNFFILRTNIGGTWSAVVFNLSTQTIQSMSPNFISADIEDAGNGWSLISCVFTNNSSYQHISTPTGAITFSGDGVSGAYIWGAQLTLGTTKRDYFPTTNRLNVPRLDYVDDCPTLLVEPQRTNLLAQSADFTNGWSQEGSSITGNTQISPDGLLTADSIFELATNDVHRTYRPSVAVTANAIYTASFFVKKNNVRYVRLILTQNGSTTIWAGAQFDLDTQTFTSQVGTGGGVFTDATITSFINGWYRISVSGSIPDTAMIPMLALSDGSAMLNTDTRGCPVYLGNVSNSLFIWGAQLELGSNVTSYIPTTTATVTRNADVITNTNASTLIGQTEGSMYVEFNNTPYVTAGGGFRWLLCMRDPLTNNFLKIYRNTAASLVNRVGMEFHNGTFVLNLFSPNTYNMPLGRNKVLITYQNGLYKLFQNGDLRATVSNILTVPTNMSRVDVGSFVENTSANLNDGIYTAALYKTALTDAQAIQLTTL